MTLTAAIDMNLGLELVGGREELATQMLDLFISMIPEHQTEIDTALKNKDSKQLAAAAHKFLGATCYVGTPYLKQITKKLETAAKQENPNNLDEIYQDFCKAINDVLACYNEIQKT